MVQISFYPKIASKLIDYAWDVKVLFVLLLLGNASSIHVLVKVTMEEL